MSPIQVTPDSANRTLAAAPASKPRVIAAADPHDVMREQLEFLIEHAQGPTCGCAQCERYTRVRTLLLQAFDEAPKQPRAVAA